MSDEVQLSMSLPLDGDGFLRRECPTCEREFKWLPSPDQLEEGNGDSRAAAPHAQPPEAYYCPYCAVTAPPDAWFTKAQIAVMHDIARREREIAKLNRTSGGFLGIEAHLDRDEPQPAPQLDETDDMRRVNFTCHPDEPVK